MPAALAQAAVVGVHTKPRLAPERPAMSNMSANPDPIAQLYLQAISHYNQGNMSAVEEHCQRLLSINPTMAEAWDLRAAAAVQRREPGLALEHLQTATRVQPTYVHGFLHLGKLLRLGQRLDEALDCLRRAIQLQPTFAEAHLEFAIASHLRGLHSQAIEHYQRALQIQPNLEEAFLNLGNALMEQGRSREAIACLEQGKQVLPNSASILNNLGYFLRTNQRLAEAETCLQTAVGLQPDAFGYNNLGITLNDLGKLDEAVAAFRQAIALQNDFAGAYSNLGNVLKDQGMLDASIAAYREALRLNPSWMEVHSNLLCTINPHADWSAQQILDEHRSWDEIHAKPLANQIRSHANDFRSDRPLRIGYVSPDLKAAPVGRFMLPAYKSHDRDRFHIYTYASVKSPDGITDACRKHSTVWRDVVGLTDEQLAHTIRQDEIDILVDLTMHMIDHRLLAFARKPAPIQATYLAYGGTTGLSAMDFRITDPWLDPPGETDACYSETSIRLKGCYWCYEPLDDMPEVGERPSCHARHVTFGCLNNFCKVTRPTLLAWSRILGAVPNSKLLLHAQPGSHREDVLRLLREQGVSPTRIEFVPILPGHQYFAQYHRIDIALDTFPFCGGTTTCDALWMGVPVVSLAGPRAVNRSGLSLLSNVELEEFVAFDIDRYVEIAIELANDPSRLTNLSQGMRQRLLHSRLMNAAEFTRDLEDVYRQMWSGRAKLYGRY
jgi:protein O-GlcNAc transferase